MVDNVIHISGSYDHEISDFLRLIRQGEVACGVLVYRFSNDAVNVVTIGAEEMDRADIDALLNAGVSALYSNEDVFTID
jgi:hypothetical protein